MILKDSMFPECGMSTALVIPDANRTVLAGIQEKESAVCFLDFSK